MKILPLTFLLIIFITSELIAQKGQKSVTPNDNLRKEHTQTNTNPYHKNTEKTTNKTCARVNKNRVKFIDELNLFPNPTKKFLNIKAAPNSCIEIYNIEKVMVKKVHNTFGEVFLDTRDLQQGIYRIDIIKPNFQTLSYKVQID